MTVTVFTTGPGCGKCITTKAHLKKRGVPFEEIRIDQDGGWLDRLREHGFTAAPVVLVGEDDVWDDYRPTEIDAWAEELAPDAA